MLVVGGVIRTFVALFYVVVECGLMECVQERVPLCVMEYFRIVTLDLVLVTYIREILPKFLKKCFVYNNFDKMEIFPMLS